MVKNIPSNNASNQNITSDMSFEEAQRAQIMQQAFEIATELQKQEKWGEAEKLYNEILALDPQHAGALHHLGLIEKEKGDLKTAEDFIHHAVNAKPDYAQAWNSLGTIQRKKLDKKQAIDSFETAIKIKRDYADAITNLGNIYWDLGLYKRAEKQYRKALKIDKQSALAYVTYTSLGHALRDQDKTSEALEAYDQSLKLNPGNSNIPHLKGNIQRSLGHRDKAVECFKEAISLNPDNIDAYYDLAYTKYFSDENDHDIEQFEDLAALVKTVPKSREWISKLNFARGKIQNDLGHYDAAFERFDYANKLLRETYQYDAKSVTEYFDNIIKLFTPELIKKHSDQGNKSDKPIFIVGMPRSGTTLVEQILASHPNVYGAGELKSFPKSVQKVVADEYAYIDHLITDDLITNLSEQQIKEFSNLYLTEITAKSKDASFVTDKMPTNFVMIGLIKIAFPNAKIIHCSRNAMDICVSNYNRLFTELTSWSHSLEEIGLFYKDYHRLMSHWETLFQDEIYTVNYSNIVQNQEVETRALLKYCNLEWHQDCLNFHKTERTVKTASSEQVKKPLYTSGINSWKKFEKHLQPLVKTLGSLAQDA